MLHTVLIIVRKGSHHGICQISGTIEITKTHRTFSHDSQRSTSSSKSKQSTFIRRHGYIICCIISISIKFLHRSILNLSLIYETTTGLVSPLQLQCFWQPCLNVLINNIIILDPVPGSARGFTHVVPG